MDILHWHLFTRRELENFAEREPATLVDIGLMLQDKIRHLEDRIHDLEIRINKDSHNSSKPPSSDGYTKPSPKSLREKSGRPSGGQIGHPGHTLEAVLHPDAVQVHPLMRCPKGHRLGPPLGHDKRQVFDWPVGGLEVLEHQAERRFCSLCQEVLTAPFPAGVHAPAQYGPRFLALLVYWRDQQLLPLDRIRQMVQDLFQHTISQATIQSAVTQAAHALAPFQQALEAQVRSAPQLHADETGLRVQGYPHWLHVLCTARLTWYGVHPKRGQDAMEDFELLPDFCGRLVHDEFGPYWTYGRSHVLCNAHHLRELVFAEEEEHQTWAGRLHQMLRRACQERQAHPLSPPQVQRYLKRYRLLLSDASPPQQSKAHSLRRRLLKYEGPTLAFLQDPSVPFTNNQAEQDLRMMKVQQKISGTFRTLEGARIFACLRSYITTIRKQGQSVWDGLTEALRGHPFLPTEA